MTGPVIINEFLQYRRPIIVSKCLANVSISFISDAASFILHGRRNDDVVKHFCGQHFDKYMYVFVTSMGV